MAGKAKVKPKLAVWKFASCDGCQLSLLDCEDELLEVAGALEIANFAEASRARIQGPYDLSLVEGSVTTPHDAERIHQVRRASKVLVTIGACATAGGIQALRNFADAKQLARWVYPSPDLIPTLAKSTPIADHVEVDLELRGCPINKRQLLEVVRAFLDGSRPNLPRYSVCAECKRRGTVCLQVAEGISCLGPVTQAGCGALCPSYHRGCFGCYGPAESPNTAALGAWLLQAGVAREDLVRLFRSYNAGADEFRRESEVHER
ncbi:MAG TPA: hypothetical protein VMS93_06340 [Candidatus Saccharimonadales bacterium]|nr:hypothetical protein [Candidatus Saccharimonadales bacterium]